mmetsp:Transcript_23138/g.50148  ORF Transcript_23138/g.50148 Transcript_23138/m.50148 type:complete len:375 (-) Transcript_23138:36-1160(-)
MLRPDLHWNLALLLPLLVGLVVPVHAFNAFSIPRSHHVSSSSNICMTKLRATSGAEGLATDENDANTDTVNDRRTFLECGAIILGATAASLPSQSALATSASDPVCVIGCNGRTGTEVVSYLLSRGMPVRATSRGGEYNAKNSIQGASSMNLLKEMVCDVTVPSSVTSAVASTRAVVFAASASKAGGPPSAVDNAGLVAVAKACIDAKVPHLVIVSSGAVTKPSSPVYQFLNLFGRIMEEKIRGEDAVRKLYADYNKSNDTSLTYTVIRPGGLTLDPPRGVGALELNQGDTKSGRIARADVAALCVESISYPDLTGGTTFECYDADTGAPLATVGLSNIAKKKTDSEVFVSGKERRGNTYKDLFTGLEKDSGYS